MSRIDFLDPSTRQLVRLPDGREGVLLWVSPRSGVAKVRVGGRHVRLPARDLAPTGRVL